MFTIKLSRRFAILGLLACLTGVSGSALGQQPLVTRFVPDLPVFPQYFGVMQSQDGMLYLGHAGAVARYDGARWIDIQLPEDGAVREFHRDRHGRIWVGGTNTFGYFERQSTGADRYIDLANKFPGIAEDEVFADIWRILEREDGIYFGALRHLFHVSHDGEPMTLWKHEGRFGAMADVAGEFWVQWRGEGLKQLVNGEFLLLPGGEQFDAPLITNLIPIDQDRVFVHSSAPHFSMWQDGSFSRMGPVGRNAELSKLVAGVRVGPATIAFGGSDGIVRIIDVNTFDVHAARVSQGFVSDIKVAMDQSLLTSSDDGVGRLSWPSAWTEFSEAAGIRGLVNKIVTYENSLFVLAQSGVYVTTMTGNEFELPFHRLNWTANEAWDLMPNEHGLMLAASQGLRTPTETGASRVGPEALYPRAMLVDPDDSTTLWVGTEHGPALFKRGATGWGLVAHPDRLGAKFDSIAPAGNGNVWLGTSGLGLFLARPGEGTSPSIEMVNTGAELGLELDSSNAAFVSDTGYGILVSTGLGTFRWQKDRFVKDDLGGLDAIKPPGEIVEFKDGAEGVLWAFSYRGMYRKAADGWTIYNLSNLGKGVFNAFHVLPGGEVLAGGASLLLRLSPDHIPANHESTRLNLVGVRVDAGGQLTAHALDQPLQVLSATGPVSFQFGLSQFDGHGSTRYQYRLAGESAGWSTWTDRAEIVFNALGPGSYTLMVRAKTSSGKIIDAQPVQFRIIPRWYEHALTRIAAGLLVFLIALGLVQIRNRHKVALLARQNEMLEQTVRARTAELEQANAKLHSQATRDQLTGVGNRRLFDSKLAGAVAAARVSHHPLALMMIDVDHFKHFNDTRGHQAGDEILQQLAVALSNSVRGADTMVARYGGEEFAVIAERCDPASADQLAKRLVTDVERELKIVTISVGVASFDSTQDSAPESLIKRADAALYEAKHQGRNRAVIAA